MSNHRETRKVLWGERAVRLMRAQELDAEIETLRLRVQIATDEATECRRCADQLGLAAELLANITIEGT